MKNIFPKLFGTLRGLGARRKSCDDVFVPVLPDATEPDPREVHRAQLTFRRPMLDLNAAKAVTGLDEEVVLREIDLGRIRWAFNFGAGGKRHVLILTRSLACYSEPALMQPDTIGEVADLLLPSHSHTSGNVRGTELQFAFNITSEQVTKLRRAGLIVESRHSNSYRGRSGSPLFTRTSVVQFLKHRRLV